MQKFLTRTLFFFIPLLVVNAFIFAVIQAKGVDDDYLRRARDIPPWTRGILLADSHGKPLDSSMLTAAGIANLSAGSDSYVDMMNKLRYALDHAEIRTVIVTADDHCLSAYRERMNNSERSIFLNNKPGLLDLVKKYVPLLNGRSRDFFKLIVEASLRPDRVEAQEAPAADLGWKTNPHRVALAEERAARQFPSKKISQSLRAELEEIARLCNERSIRLVGLKFPLAGDFLRAIRGRGYGSDTVLLAAGVEVFDYTELYADRDEYFSNPDHLGPEGGQRFTALLLERLAAPSP